MKEKTIPEDMGAPRLSPAASQEKEEQVPGSAQNKPWYDWFCVTCCCCCYNPSSSTSGDKDRNQQHIAHQEMNSAEDKRNGVQPDKPATKVDMETNKVKQEEGSGNFGGQYNIKKGQFDDPETNGIHWNENISGPQQLFQTDSSEQSQAKKMIGSTENGSSPSRNYEKQISGVVKQGSCKEGKNHTADSPLKTTKNGQVSINIDDYKYKDDGRPKTSQRSLEQNDARERSFNTNDIYAETSSAPVSGVEQKFVRKTSFSKDENKFKDTSPAKTSQSSAFQSVARQPSFNKDDRDTDTAPAKTTKNNIERTGLEDKQKGFPKQEKKNENQTDSRPGSLIVSNSGSPGQGRQLLSKEQAKVVGKQGGINKDDTITVPSNTGQASKEKQKDSNKQDNS